MHENETRPEDLMDAANAAAKALGLKNTPSVHRDAGLAFAAADRTKAGAVVLGEGAFGHGNSSRQKRRRSALRRQVGRRHRQTHVNPTRTQAQLDGEAIRISAQTAPGCRWISAVGLRRSWVENRIGNPGVGPSPATGGQVAPILGCDPMRLSAFILENMEPILQEWEDFARALGAVTERMDAKALRDHAKQILREVAADLETYQSEAQQEAKSKGNAPPAASEPLGTGAERHGDVRATEGFTLDQMVSEYRALRASVLRLWTKKGGIDDPSEAEQVTRFNEAIDEALAESVKRYARDVERLIASAHGKERMAALGTLSAGLGHDMSNVLMPMRMSLEMLERMALTPESKPMLDSLRRSLEHLGGLARGLRSLSVDPEETEASPATTELHAWWAEAISPYKWVLSPEVTLHASGLESLSLPAVAVPKHVLMQAVFNLVQNAAEALSTRGEGNIWVSATVGEDGATVSLVVRDDGSGMDAQTLARCTEPFFTTKPRGRGTGLGLSLVRSAIERHGGRLVIESHPNMGSAFTLVLPVAGPGHQSRGVRRATLTVRDARVRAMVTALLSGVGVEVSVQRATGGIAVVPGREGETSRGFLWVADDSVDPLDVLRFLDEGGPDVRVVVLGSWMPVDPGSAGEAAVHDGHLIQIADAPSHTTLQDALRRAVMG